MDNIQDINPSKSKVNSLCGGMKKGVTTQKLIKLNAKTPKIVAPNFQTGMLESAAHTGFKAMYFNTQSISPHVNRL